MSYDSIGVQPDELDSNAPLSRIKIETEQPLKVDENTFEQSIQNATSQFTTTRYSELSTSENLAYLIVESNPLSIDLSTLTTEIENTLDCHVKEVWIRRTFYDELNEIKQTSLAAVEDSQPTA